MLKVHLLARLGKFQKLEYLTTGNLTKCFIVLMFTDKHTTIFADLLEKSRVTYQLPGVERNYHIFYWLLSGQYPDYAGNECTSVGKKSPSKLSKL